jgi:endonuclease I
VHTFLKKSILPFFFFLCSLAIAQIPDYYKDIDLSTSGQQLFDELSQLITDTHSGVTYATIWNLLKEADLDPDDPTFTDVLLVYGYNDNDGISQTDRSRDKDLNCNFSGSCTGYWNREHVFPQSLADPPMTTSSIGTGTDAHNLRACDVQANSHRGNNKFAAGSGDPFYGGVDDYYPGDEWRGDVARIILYMYLRYLNECLPTYVGTGPTTYNIHVPDIFLQWNADDTVSDFEIQRNEVIYSYQGNRNPFIDNPYLATLIWGGPNAENLWPMDGSDIVFDPNFQVPSQIDYINYTNTGALTTTNAVEIGRFVIRDGGETAETDLLPTRLSEITFFVNEHENLNRAALFLNGNKLDETVVQGDNITFDNFMIEVPDGGGVTLSLYVSFEDTVTDNAQFSFNITQAVSSGSSTPFAFNNAGGAITPTDQDDNTINVTATKLQFLQQPTTVDLQQLMQPAPEIEALDINGNRDLDFEQQLSMTTTSLFTNNAVTTFQAQQGTATFDELFFDLAGSGFTLTVSSADATILNIESDAFTVNNTPVVMSPDQVFITEVSDHSDFKLEFLEIYNHSNRQVTLNSSKLVMYPDETVWGFGATSGNSIPSGVIEPRGFAIITRGGTLEEFETQFGPLNVNTTFIQGSQAMYFAVNSGRTWKLFQGGVSGVADGQLIDDTEGFAVTNNQRISQNLFTNSYTYSTSSLANPGELDDLIYVAGAWVNNEPADSNSANRNVYFFDDFTLTQPISALHSGIDAPYILNLNGFNLSVSDEFTFVSNASGTAQLDQIISTENIVGEVTFQRYFPARRAFRFVSFPVTTVDGIREHWQESVNNTNATNQDPNPGYGTHITGSASGANGFDSTPSGNTSLFTLDNSSQSWVAATNTATTPIEAGKAYRILLRGDRSIDLNNNSAVPTNTILRAKGALAVGPVTDNTLSNNAGHFNFIGNPLPAIVDMNAVLAAATNLNDAYYYIWDPNMGTRGAYITVELPGGTNSAGSAGNQYLQPGQAAFVATLENGQASLTFQESHKSVNQPLTQVFNVESKIDLRLYPATAFAQNERASDAVRIKFREDYSNAVTPVDAAKFYNIDENLAANNNGTLLSIEARALPEDGETIQLFTNQYRKTDYVFEARLTEMNEVQVFLKDHYTGSLTELFNNDTTLYAFQVDANNPASLADDRFEFFFKEMLMHTNELQFGYGFVLFPNPAQGEINIATRGIAGQEVQLSITSVLGQLVYNNTLTVNSNGMLSVNITGSSNGVYILKLSDANGGQFITRFIKK